MKAHAAIPNDSRIFHGVRFGLPMTVFCAWVFCICFFFHAGLQMDQTAGSIILAGAWLTITWLALVTLFSIYHTISFIFSLCARFKNRVTRPPEISDVAPSVAILYTCMNDFDEDAYHLCLNLDYNNYSLFVLDDSTSAEEIQRVARIVEAHPGCAQILQRTGRNGFKAGNLNHAIAKIGSRFDYYCVVDADERLPADFLKRTVAIAEGDPDLGFVQAAHRTYAMTAPGRLLGGGLRTHWDFFLPVRNHSGFQYFIGHGALLKTSAVHAVGGFNSVIAEDLDIAVRMRMIGYRGYFDAETHCLEAAPSSYQAFRRRSEKVMAGTLEFLSQCYPRFVRCREVSVGEKLDVFLGTGVVLLPAVFVLVIAALFLALPILHALAGGNMLSYGLGLRSALAPLNRQGLVPFVLFSIVAPALYNFPDLATSPWRHLVALVRLAGVHLSTSIYVTGTALRWFGGGKREFVATGDRQAPRSGRSWLGHMIGGCLLLIGLLMNELSVVALGTAVLWIPPLVANRRSPRLRGALMCLPFSVAVFALVVDPVSAAIGAGLYTSIACLHH